MAATTMRWMTLTPAGDAALEVYLQRVDQLYAQIAHWVAADGYRAVRDILTVREARHGRYQAPLLRIQSLAGEELARCEPYGASILGAWGRVDVLGWRSRRKLVYLTAGGPTLTMRLGLGGPAGVPEGRAMLRDVATDGWYWLAPPPTAPARLLDDALFRQLLRDVSGLVKHD